MTITDCSGTKPLKVHVQSATHTLIDGFQKLEYAFRYARCMMGSYNNCGQAGQCEQYTHAFILDGSRQLAHIYIKPRNTELPDEPEGIEDFISFDIVTELA